MEKIILAFFAGIIGGVLVEHFLLRRNKKSKAGLMFTYFADNFLQIKSNKMAVIFKPNQNATFQVTPTNRRGQPAKVQEGSVEYSSPDPSVVVEEDPTDETKFKVTTSADEITESKTVDVSVSADADLGDGIKTITGVLTVVIEPEGAEGFGITTITEPTDNV